MVSYLCPIRALSALLKWCLVKIPGDQILLEMLDKRKMIFFITISPVSMQITVSYLLTAYHSRGSKRGERKRHQRWKCLFIHREQLQLQAVADRNLCICYYWIKAVQVDGAERQEDRAVIHGVHDFSVGQTNRRKTLQRFEMNTETVSLCAGLFQHRKKKHIW